MKTLDNMQDEPIIDKPATANASRASRSNHPGKQQEQDEQEMSAEELNRRERVRANMDAKEAQKHARVVRGTMLVMLTASLMTFVYLGSPSDNDDPAPENESAFGGYWRRTKKNLGFITAVK